MEEKEEQQAIEQEEYEDIPPYPPTEPLKINLKIGDLVITLPLIEDIKSAEKYLDLTIKKMKEMIKDKSIKEYLDIIKSKKAGSSYLG